MSKTTIVAAPGKQEIVVTRDFDAPRELVYRVLTDPELRPHWWGPRYLTTTVETMDAREGGTWRFIQRDPEGNDFAFNGVYHVVDAPRQIVETFEFEGLPERHVALDTTTLVERDGVTTLTQTSVFQTVADRDGMVASGMEGGARESMERVAELLDSLLVNS